MTKKPKLIYSIRAKLISAVAMLLVAVIMVVSSTYAWFTLSTAPEITGIQTAIGANGALEIALRHSKDGVAQNVIEGMVQTGTDSNHYWGNLINLDQDGLDYGVDKIVLLPSTLNATGDQLGAFMLSTPTYGADGRVSGVSPNAASGTYNPANGGAFYQNNDFGFRGVGVASGLTERQLAYRTAKAAASTAIMLAKDTASQSLSENGGSLANIALKKAVDGTALYTKAEVLSLLGITYDLLGGLSDPAVAALFENEKIGSLEYIEDAYMQYVVAYAAGTQGGAGEAWTVVKNAVEEEGATLTTVLAKLNANGIETPSQVSGPLDAYNTMISEVKAAQTGLLGLYNANAAAGDTDAVIEWDDLTTHLAKLADIDAMKVNGRTPAQVRDDLNGVINEVAGGKGINVTIESGGGVYADIADHCGDFDSSVEIDKVKYGGVELGPISAHMATVSNVLPSYLSLLGKALDDNSPEYVDAAGDAEKPFTEMYGYVIDMAFRTNAKESNLLLQTTPTDRIYEGNTNEETMGGGSSMTFKSTSSNFSNDDIKELMKHIRIVFFVPGDHANSGGTIVAYAKLDADNATVGADGLTANMYLYKQVADQTITINEWKDESGTLQYYEKEGSYYTAAGAKLETAPDDLADLTMTPRTETLSYKEEIITETEDAILAALPQDQEYYISALVYLDGETLTNADVAYDVSPSMSGKTNFQFSSSANLVPMEYGNLHHGDEGAGEGGGAGAATEYTVTVPEGVTGETKATANTAYTFTVGTDYTLGTVTVGGTEVTPTAGENGAYTIPADKVTGNIVINVTANG